MSSQTDEICVNCHFLIKESNPHKFEVSPQNRGAIRNKDYSWLRSHESLACHHGIWDEGYYFDPRRRNEIMVETNRAGSCYFFAFHPGMFLPTAEKLQQREAVPSLHQPSSTTKAGPVTSGQLWRAAILTALRPEYDAVREHLADIGPLTHPAGTIYEVGRFEGNNSRWEVLVAEIGVGNPRAAAEAERAISSFNPTVVLFVGVAGGIKDVQLGDVVVSTKVYNYASGKARNEFQPRPESHWASYRLEQRARYEARQNTWRQRIRRPAGEPDRTPQAFVQPIASGEAVVASTRSEVYKFLTAQYGDAIAVEMEGHGVLLAAHINQPIEAMVVRGISDTIRGKRRSDAAGWQPIAARHAAAFAFQLLAGFEGRNDRGGDGPASPTSPPNNLPRQLTSFIGREQAMAEVKHLLATTRLLTLTGSGGCGKTRLALQVAADLLEEYPDGVWLVELAPLADPALVPQTVASALGVREEPGRPLTTTLTDHLRAKSLLLVLDNCEHLLTACAQLVDTLLRSCPDLRILASSREALGIGGEQTYRVPSLAVPDATHLPPLNRLQEFEAVQMFADRARLSQASFAVTEANAAAVVQVCQRLDGIPLAIELAAARVKALPVEQIAERLDDRFRLLTGGSRTALPRQQTLRASIDWSYDLLCDAERALLRRLSVFVGGWMLEAAEAVCVGEGIEEWDVLDLLTALVQKSLVLYEEREGEARYRLLETVRQYARDRLLETHEAAGLNRRHQDWLLGLARRAKKGMAGPEQVEWLDLLEREHDNLRAALQRSLTGDRGEIGLCLGGLVLRFWTTRNHVKEGRRFLESLLEREEAQKWTARFLSRHLTRDLLARRIAPVKVRCWGEALIRGVGASAWLANDDGDTKAMRKLFRKSLRICRNLQHKRSFASALFDAGGIATQRGKWDTALFLLRKSLALFHQLEDEPDSEEDTAWGIPSVLGALGDWARERKDYAAARSYHEQALAIWRPLGNKGTMSWLLGGLGELASLQGDFVAAGQFFAESVALFRELGHERGLAWAAVDEGILLLRQQGRVAARSRFTESLQLCQHLDDEWGTAQCIRAFAALAVVEEHLERAAVLFGAASQALEASAARLLWPGPPLGLEPYEASTRSGVGPEGLSADWQKGQAMTLDDAVEYALKETNDA